MHAAPRDRGMADPTNNWHVYPCTADRELASLVHVLPSRVPILARPDPLFLAPVRLT